MKIYYLFVVCVFYLFSCKEEPQPYIPEPKDSVEIIDGAIYKTPYIWRAPLTDSDHKNGWVFTDIKYNNGFLTFITQDKTLYLALLSCDDGQIIWKEPRKIRREGSPFDDGIELAYQYDRYLVNEFIGIGEYGYECIDLKTGKQLWETNTKAQGVWIENISQPCGLDSLFFFRGRPLSMQLELEISSRIYCGNVKTGKIRELPMPQLIDSIHMDSLNVGLVMPYYKDNQIEVLVGYSSHKKSYIAVYNYKSQTWERKNISVPGEICNQTYYYNNNRFVICTLGDSASVICGNIETTEINWTRPDIMYFLGIVELGDYYIGFDSRTNPYDPPEFSAINKYTGETVWQIFETHAVYPVYTLNNYVYFHTGLIYGINGLTGKKIWHLKPNDGGRFTQVIMVSGKNGEKDRIIGCSGGYAYCYEALQDIKTTRK
ncbi:MAG TPA: hypothetical protein PK734_02920 [Bacteroidales bacterium]|nr:MAG: PQQ enzyme repeat protein [Bacteroidetes bacterium ADurb.Bin217]HOS84106.1 hypothetical protein [Bacteroidales bacterium]HPM12426.1 hypothetical protein [Bacteroidales bacterium]